MMKHRIATTLAIAVVASASFGLTAFASAENQVSYSVTVKDTADAEREIPMYDFKTDEYGVRYYDTADGVRISIADAGSADHKDVKQHWKVDDQGNRYIEMEDGSRVYVTQAKSASVD